MSNHKYGEEIVEFVRERTATTMDKDLAVMIKEEFGIEITAANLRALRHRKGLTTGIKPSDKQGFVAHNKGKKDLKWGKATRFKKGQQANKTYPVGAERLRWGKHLQVKIAEPSVWKCKHVIEWEKHNGPLPEGGCLMFLDGDMFNTHISNLKLVTRQELLVMNRNKWITKDPQLNEFVANTAKLVTLTLEKKRGRLNGNSENNA